MANNKLWTGGFTVIFIVVVVFGLLAGLYFLMISGLSERSNPIGSVFALVGLLLVSSPAMLLLGRYLVFRSRR